MAILKASKPTFKASVNIKTYDGDDHFVAVFSRPTDKELADLKQAIDIAGDDPQQLMDIDKSLMQRYFIGVEQLTDESNTPISLADAKPLMIDDTHYRAGLIKSYLTGVHNLPSLQVGNSSTSATTGDEEGK